MKDNTKMPRKTEWLPIKHPGVRILFTSNCMQGPRTPCTMVATIDRIAEPPGIG